MSPPRSPKGNTTPNRQRNSIRQKQWENLKKEFSKGNSDYPDAYTGGKAKFYKDLWTINETIQSEVLAAALLEIEIFGVDGPDWQIRLREMKTIEQGGSEEHIAAAIIEAIVFSTGNTVAAAAAIATAENGLFMESNSFATAVTRARTAYANFKAGKLPPFQTLRNLAGLYVRPRTDNLKPGEVRVVRDPNTAMPLPPGGAQVSDTTFWRNAVKLGLVEKIEPPQP